MQKILNQKLVDTSVDEESEGEEENGGLSGGKKKGRPKLAGAPSAPTTHSASVSPAALSSISPKAKIPNNPLLKKKLLNLQKFLTEYTVRKRERDSLVQLDSISNDSHSCTVGRRSLANGSIHGKAIEESLSRLL